MGRLQLVTDAANEPLGTDAAANLAAAKLFLRIDDTAEDALALPEMITAARRRVEKYTRRSLITTTWRYTVDAREMDRAARKAQRRSGGSPSPLPRLSLSGVEIVLPRPPALTISSVKYYGDDDVAVTYATTNYRLDTSSDRSPRLVFKYGATLPAVRELGSFEVNYTSGYGAQAAVPDDLVQAVKRVLAAIYENRGDTLGESIEKLLDDLIPTYRIQRVG